MKRLLKLEVKWLDYSLDSLSFLDRLDDKDLVPTIGLGTLAGLIAWKSNQPAPIPLKSIYSIGGIIVSTLLTHEKLRNRLKEAISTSIPEDIKAGYRVVDERIGMFGANIWNHGEDIFIQAKSKLLNKH